MQKILVICLLALILFGCNSAPNVAFKVIDGGVMCDIREESYYVIDNQEAWSHLWREYQARRSQRSENGNGELLPPPAVDFTKEMVVAVFMGERGTAGYDVRVQNVVEDGAKITVDVLYFNPRKNEPLAAVMTHPYCVCKFQPKDIKKSVKLNIKEETRK